MSHDHHNTLDVAVTINGTERSATVEARTLLVHYIRDHLGLTGTHWGCDTSNCGVCVDHFASGHSLEALDDVIRAISVTTRPAR